MSNIADTALLAGAISKAEEIVLVGHVNPDGDSIGSLMGMKGYLETVGKKVTENGFENSATASTIRISHGK